MFSLVVQRLRHLGHNQETMVRLHPGLLFGPQVLPGKHTALVWRKARFDPGADLLLPWW